GQFRAGGTAEVCVVAASGGSLRVDLWGFDRQLTPRLVSSTLADQIHLQGPFAVAAADIDRSGTSELVVVYAAGPNAGGAHLFVSSVVFGPDGKAAITKPAAVGTLGGGGLALASGAFSPTSVDEQVALGWSTDGRTASAAICTFDAHLTPSLRA